MVGALRCGYMYRALLILTCVVAPAPALQVGQLYDVTQSWEASLFAPSALCMLTGALVYTLYAENKPVDFDSLDNSPFAWEKWLPKLPKLPFGANKSASNDSKTD
jgi:ACS family sodium-dependent inorganic phosphate cotransporter